MWHYRQFRNVWIWLFIWVMRLKVATINQDENILEIQMDFPGNLDNSATQQMMKICILEHILSVTPTRLTTFDVVSAQFFLCLSLDLQYFFSLVLWDFELSIEMMKYRASKSKRYVPVDLFKSRVGNVVKKHDEEILNPLMCEMRAQCSSRSRTHVNRQRTMNLMLILGRDIMCCSITPKSFFQNLVLFF